MNERDTHFQGAASLLYDEIVDAFHGLYYAIGEPEDGLGMTTDDYERAIKKIIAQRAYDLAYHVCDYITEPMTHWYSDDMVSEIPDLTEWPDTSPHPILDFFPDPGHEWPNTSEQ